MESTFLFTDIEGSTRSWDRDGDAMSRFLLVHDRIMERSVIGHGGRIVKHTGDGVFAVFHDPLDAVRCSAGIQRELSELSGFDMRVRMGLHTGTSEIRGEDHFGPAVNMSQRIMDAGSGGQILLSEDLAARLSGMSDGLRLVDLGIHRLRDLGEPRRIFILEYPGMSGDVQRSLRTLDAVPNNLQRPMTSFIGRERELHGLRVLLRGDGRLITLHGPGGSGKTRLALQTAAMEAVAFPEGVYFVQLEGTHSSDLVPAAVAESMGLDTEGSDDPGAAVLAFVSSRRILLVLDNYEHLSDDSRFLQLLIASCENVRVMVTSRNRLRLSGEHVFQVKGMTLPDGTSDVSSDSELLYMETARRLGRIPESSETESVRRICTLLSGNPLAIVMAASWSGMLTADEILEELSESLSISANLADLPERHRNLRAVFMFSWRILSHRERMALCSLSIFQGRFTRRAAAEVNGLGVSDLSDLCGKSLLERYEDGSFGIPALVRDFAVEMVNEIMETSMQNELRHRHCAFFLNLLSDSSSELVSGDRKRAAGELAMFLHDMLEAWTFAVRGNLHGLLLQACVPFRTLLGIRNMYREGMQLMEESIAGLGEPAGREALELRGWLLSSLGWFCSFCGSGATSIGHLEEAVGTFRSSGSGPGLADALNLLGNVLYVSGDSERAFAAYEESLGIRRGLSDSPGVAAVLNNLGNLSCQKTEYEKARAYYQESLRLQRIIGNQHGISSILSNLAIVSIALDDLENAGLMLREALELEMNIGDRFNSAIVQGILCELHLKTGNLEEVERLCRDNLAKYESAGNAWGMAESFSTLARLHMLRGNLRDSAEALLHAMEMISGRDWDPLALKILGRSAELLVEAEMEDEASETVMFVSGHGSCPPELRAEMEELLLRSGLETADECTAPDGDLDRMLACAAGKLTPLLR